MSENRDKFLNQIQYNPMANNYPFDLDEFINSSVIDKDLHNKENGEHPLENENEVANPFISEHIENMHEDRGII